MRRIRRSNFSEWAALRSGIRPFRVGVAVHLARSPINQRFPRAFRLCRSPGSTQRLYTRLAQDLVNGRERQLPVLVQSKFILNSPRAFVLGTQSKDRCPIGVGNLSVRAAEWTTTLGLEAGLTGLLIARQPFAKRRSRDATPCAYEAGITRLVIHAHPP